MNLIGWIKQWPFRVLILFTFIGILTSNCEHSVNPIHGLDSTKGFALTWLKGLNELGISESEAIEKIEDTNFSLGDITETTDFFFILNNTGQDAITDISLSITPDSSFEIYPQNIDTLFPSKYADFYDPSKTPIIRLTALHGYANNAFGGAMRLLDPGLNSLTLNISGRELQRDGFERPIYFTSEMTVNAMLMDLRLFDGSKEIDLRRPNGTITGGSGEIRFTVYKYDVVDSVSVENTGNVPIIMKLFAINELDTLQIGETLLLDILEDTHVMFDNHGIMRDFHKLPLYRDGKTYIILKWSR